MGRILRTLVFLLYAALTLWVTLHHEAWRDEADTWLLMRDGDLASIFGLTAYRGTPLLWYLALWPFAKGGAPYVSQQFLNLAFAWGAIFLLLRSRAFPWPVKILFTFSYYAAFEYAVIARNYALLMFLLFLTAALWRTRRERPVSLGVAIALLANTSAHGLLIAAVAGQLLLIESIHDGAWRERRNLLALAIAVSGGFLAALQLLPKPGGQLLPYLVQMDTVWYALTSAFFPAMRQTTAILPSLLVLGLVVIAVSHRAVPLLFLSESIAFLLALFTFAWMSGPRHAGLILLVTVAALWIADAYGPSRGERLAMAALAVSLACSLPLAVSASIRETREPYSGSRDLARYLREHQLVARPLVASDALRQSPLVYLPRKRWWYAGLGRYGSYARWDRLSELSNNMPVAAVIARAEERFPRQPWLLLLTEELPRQHDSALRLLYRTPRTPWGRADERFWLYESERGRLPRGSRLGAVPKVLRNKPGPGVR